jgi:hypothetical protein
MVSWEKFEGGEKRKDFLKMVLLLWATGPKIEKFEGGEKCKDFLKMVLLLWATGTKWKKCKDFSKWFHCYGQPAQIEDEKCFERGLITMGDLPGQEDKMSEKDDIIGLDGEQGLKSTLERR